MFRIEFIAELQSEEEELSRRGRITLDEFSEQFITPLIFWSADEYRRQWREAAERVVHGAGHSCFVTAMYKSPAEGVIFFWSAYREGEAVFFQQRLLCAEHVKGSFDPSNPYAQVGERETMSGEGNVVSEWQVPVKEVAKFLGTV